MNIAVVGGGINGVMSAWALLKNGHTVTLFERNKLMDETSSASTKLLHGGLRYLEQGAFGLVRESLRERRWWIDFAPDLCWRQEILLPLYRDSRRSKWLVELGIRLYQWLAGNMSLGHSTWISHDEVLRRVSGLKSDGLLGAWSFYDAAMDDKLLGLRAANQAVSDGLLVRENCQVEHLSENGSLSIDGAIHQFDVVVNAAGPWSKQLLRQSGIDSHHDIDYVRGSHIVIDTKCDVGLLLEYPNERRVFFVLPYKNMTLIGTTEIRQSVPEAESPSEGEVNYLLRGYVHYFGNLFNKDDIRSAFSGVRPLIRSASDPSRATREYAFEISGKLLSIFGGKWTTSRALGEAVSKTVEKNWGKQLGIH